jgi:peptidoglycan hydrolase-like protein with peptidoglycan-binding domain
VVITAAEIAEENEQYIKDLAGDPPKNTDPTAVSISTMQVGTGPIQVLNPDQVIVLNAGKKTTGIQSLITGAVQSELNDIMNKSLKVDGWYERITAGTVADFQKTYQLIANGVFDAKTFYHLESIYGLNLYTYYANNTQFYADSNSNADLTGSSYVMLDYERKRMKKK